MFGFTVRSVSAAKVKRVEKPFIFQDLAEILPKIFRKVCLLLAFPSFLFVLLCILIPFYCFPLGKLGVSIQDGESACKDVL